ncbi:hypothetical protein F5Y18DRAFT_433487 [Xylariaceae sp. FL1019]|nr:hypothetical protein F5Y18DRAFT_433487 [Xylariaceae sp. FL1019]
MTEKHKDVLDIRLDLFPADHHQPCPHPIPSIEPLIKGTTIDDMLGRAVASIVAAIIAVSGAPVEPPNTQKVYYSYQIKYSSIGYHDGISAFFPINAPAGYVTGAPAVEWASCQAVKDSLPPHSKRCTLYGSDQNHIDVSWYSLDGGYQYHLRITHTWIVDGQQHKAQGTHDFVPGTIWTRGSPHPEDFDVPVTNVTCETGTSLCDNA